MIFYMNSVNLVGRLTKDPELEHGENADRTVFNLAVNDYYYDGDGNRQEVTHFPTVIAWRKQAQNICKYLEKGSQIAIEGKLATDSWEDEETGQMKKRTKVVAKNVQFLGGGNGNNNNKKQPDKQPTKEPAGKPGTPPSPDNDDEEIPF